MASQGSTKKPDAMGVETMVACCKEKPLLTRRATEQVIDVNRRLLREIDTLKLKMETETRQHENSKAALMSTSEQKIKTRELEIENLKNELEKKGDRMQGASQENKEKQKEIAELQLYIEQLKEDVRASKDYAEKIQNQLDCFQQEKAKLETGEAYTEKDEEIVRLQTEVDSLKLNLRTLDEELVKSKEAIAMNGYRLRHVENDKFNMQLQFKEDLAKISQTMGCEMDKIKEVMNYQWREMRMLREQNEGLRSDIREVRDLLVAEMHLQNKPQQPQQRDIVERQKPPLVFLPVAGNDKRKYQTGRKKL